MPWYHIHIVVKGKEYYEYDQSLTSVKKLIKLYSKGQNFLFSGIRIDPHDIGKIRIYETESLEKNITGARVWDVGINATRRFIGSPPSEAFAPKPRTKDVFIVHGTDHKPLKELKTLLCEFGLNPIVLHEQPSGSRTIVEQLEKYSGKVGYAFVILTPDDVGCLKKRYLNLHDVCLSKENESENKRKNMEFFFRNIIKMLINRARQNVILEFGLFMGKLGRGRVCCLYKDVELPSDMHGIVYIRFKESVNEVRDKIVKELKAVGYEIKM